MWIEQRTLIAAAIYVGTLAFSYGVMACVLAIARPRSRYATPFQKLCVALVLFHAAFSLQESIIDILEWVVL